MLLVSTVVTALPLCTCNIAATTETLYNNPYASVAMPQAQASTPWLAYEGFGFGPDQKTRDAYAAKINQLQAQVMGNFDTLYERFMGDHALIDAAVKAFKDWEPIRSEVIRYLNWVMPTRPPKSPGLRVPPGGAMNKPFKIVDDAMARAEAFNNQARTSAASATYTVVGLC